MGLNPIAGHGALNLTGGEQLIDESALEVVWASCTKQLSSELPAQQFNTWIRPLRAQLFIGDVDAPELPQRVQLIAPNRFIEDWVKNKFLTRIAELFAQFDAGQCTVAVVAQAEKVPVFKAEADRVNNRVLSNAGATGDNRISDGPDFSRPAVTAPQQIDESASPSGFAPQDRPLIQRITAPAIITSAAEHSLKSNLNSAFHLR